MTRLIDVMETAEFDTTERYKAELEPLLDAAVAKAKELNVPILFMTTYAMAETFCTTHSFCFVPVERTASSMLACAVIAENQTQIEVRRIMQHLFQMLENWEADDG